MNLQITLPPNSDFTLSSRGNQHSFEFELVLRPDGIGGREEVVIGKGSTAMQAAEDALRQATVPA